ncbi:hypothetical protein Poly30_38370 [Planctomycetes bacterium Poly30]|uniref:HEAT repeat protein n=1 Tax=Saltatorellus ferox TaxID=2528018 RepID=A0A518EW37_9BACT|nr:hypothetical protein Poly30_38370 [Planctomycetes bacterium Poly30]
MLHTALALVLTAGPFSGSFPSWATLDRQEPNAPVSNERPEPARRRILQTTGGGILRGKSRMTDEGQWQVKLERGWTDVPSAAVESVFLESELLDELDARKKKDGLEPADLLEWTLGAGLLKEAFELGDRLVEEFPRDFDLRMVAAGQVARFVAGLPERGAENELEELREIGSRGSHLVAEAIVERLATAAPRGELLAALHEDLRSRKTGRRSFASLAMGRLFSTEDPRALLLHSVYDPSVEVRRSAALGLADMGSAEVCGPLVKALGSKSSTVRTRAAEALGSTRDSVFVEPLMDRALTLFAQGSSGGSQRPPRGYIFIGTQRAYVQDFDVEVAARSSIADPVINTLLEGSVLGASVISLETATISVERRAFLGALALTTGQTPGRGRPSDWKAWWESDASASFRGDSPGRKDSQTVR